MAELTLETGTGLTNSNAYCDADFAEEYHEDERLHVSDWTGADDDDKDKALIWATNILDTRINWSGYKKSTTQALRWPRYSVLDLDGHTLSSSEIPVWLKQATAELARYLIASDRYAESDTRGIKKMKVGSLAMEMDKYDRASVMPQAVLDLCAPYGTLAFKKARKLTRAY